MKVWLSSVASDDKMVICAIVRGEILFGLGRLTEGRRRLELETKAQRLFAALPCEEIPAVDSDFQRLDMLTVVAP